MLLRAVCRTRQRRYSVVTLDVTSTSAGAELSVLNEAIRDAAAEPDVAQAQFERLEKPPLGYQKRVTVANTAATRPRSATEGRNFDGLCGISY